MSTPQERVRAAYGFDFPAEFFRFRDFLRELPDGLLADALDMRPAFPFESAGGKPATEFPERPLWQDRYYNDLPEFVTLFCGTTDGHHWGYYFDAPGELPPVVASYWHSDGFEHELDGEGLFEAVRDRLEHVESSVVEDDPGGAKGYHPGTLERLALVRAFLRPHWGGERLETGEAYLDTYGFGGWRRPVADTYDDLGIVVPEPFYENLSADPFVPNEGDAPREPHPPPDSAASR